MSGAEPNACVAATGNIVACIRQHAATAPGRPAIIEAGRAITYAALRDLIARSAGHLEALGVRRGDRVGLALQDHADHLVLMLAAASLGAASVSLNWRSKVEEMQQIAEAFGIMLLLKDRDTRGPAGTRAATLDEGWAEAVAAAPPLEPVGSADALPLRILLSSGTTGTPKGAELTHAGALGWCEIVRRALRLERPQHHLSALPLAFTGSFVFNLPQLVLGHTIELHPPLFTPDEFARAVNERGITSTIVVPTVLRRLLALAQGDAPLFPNLEYLISLGAPLTADERRAAAARLAPGFYDNYGASGAGPITFLAPQDIDAAADSVGKPAPLRDVEIVDAEGRALPRGEIGLMRCRGPGVAQRFCNDAPGGGSESFRDGWYYPGELARLDDDGFLFIAGRASDVILRAGINIYPAEIERVLQRHPAVLEAAVVGAPSAEYGEDVVAFVHLRAAAAERDLAETCRRYLTPYKVPRDIIVVDALPKNAAGKVVKPELLRMLRP